MLYEVITLDSHIIIDKSIRVGSISAKSMLAGFSSNLTSPFNQSVRAVKKSLLVEYPLSRPGFRAVAARDFKGTVNILRQLYNLFLQSKSGLKKYYSLSGRISQLHDNLV